LRGEREGKKKRIEQVVPEAPFLFIVERKGGGVESALKKARGLYLFLEGEEKKKGGGARAIDLLSCGEEGKRREPSLSFRGKWGGKEKETMRKMEEVDSERPLLFLEGEKKKKGKVSPPPISNKRRERKKEKIS